MSGWNLTQLRPDTIDPQMSADQQVGLCKFFLPIKKVISFLPKQVKRIGSGWINTVLPNSYAMRTYSTQQLQSKGLSVIPQLIGVSGNEVTASIRNNTDHHVTINGGINFLNTLMNTLSHVGPILTRLLTKQQLSLYKSKQDKYLNCFSTRRYLNYSNESTKKRSRQNNGEQSQDLQLIKDKCKKIKLK